MTGRALDFVRTVVRLAHTDLIKLSRYWVVVAGYAAILFIAIPGAALAHWAERALRITSDSGYDFAINLMVRYVDLTTPILYVMICIVFAIDVANATVKYILTRPVTRMELLASKYVTGLAMAFVTLALLWGVSLGAGAWYYGLGDLVENGYVIFEAGYVWRQIAASTAFLLIGYAAIASLAIMVSTWSSTMGGAVIVGLILFFFFQTLAIVPATLGVGFHWRGEDHVFAWSALGFPSQLYVPLTVLNDLPSGIPIASWWTFELGQFAIVCGAFFLAFLVVAAWGVRRRDFVL